MCVRATELPANPTTLQKGYAMQPRKHSNSNKKTKLLVENFFTVDIAKFIHTLEGLARDIRPDAIPARDEHWKILNESLCQSVDACRSLELEIGDNDSLLKEVQDRFRAAIHDWVTLSWIANRSISKPSGFPGDYLMLHAIYEGIPIAKGLGGYMDLCLLDLTLGKAVKARMEATRQFLLDEVANRHGDTRILNIASGPCREYIDWKQRPVDGQLHLTCLDNNPDSLDFVRRTVQPTASGISSMQLERYNVLRTRSSSATIKKFGTFDIIYSIGLCDYLPDDYLVGMFQSWQQALKENGVLFIAFKDTERYDKTPYQWHLDWHFLQRTQEEIVALFNKAGFDIQDLEITRDVTGVIINFISRQSTKPVFRFDVPLNKHLPASQNNEMTNVEDVSKKETTND